VAHSEAFEKFPDHRIEIDDARIHARVTRDGRVLAETSSGLNLREGKYPDVVYFPREDVFMQHLARSDHSTHCPFKGDASYFDVSGEDDGGGNETIREVAWSYEAPFDQMEAIRDHLAFYADRVEIEIIRD
jgi:uncharacterized protein (DUF427 family)